MHCLALPGRFKQQKTWRLVHGPGRPRWIEHSPLPSPEGGQLPPQEPRVEGVEHRCPWARPSGVDACTNGQHAPSEYTRRSGTLHMPNTLVVVRPARRSLRCRVSGEKFSSADQTKT